jgi:tetratricopeptide (TPR) repeat protein
MSSTATAPRRTEIRCENCHSILGLEDHYCPACGNPQAMQPVLVQQQARGASTFWSSAYHGTTTWLQGFAGGLRPRVAKLRHLLEDSYRKLKGWVFSKRPAPQVAAPAISQLINDQPIGQPSSQSSSVSSMVPVDAFIDQDPPLPIESGDREVAAFVQRPETESNLPAPPNSVLERSLQNSNPPQFKTAQVEPPHPSTQEHVAPGAGEVSAVPIWEKLMQAGQAALNAGRFPEAEKAFQEALTEAEGSASSVGQTLAQLAQVYVEQGNFSKAAPLAIRAVSMLERASLPGDTALADALAIAGRIRHSQKDHAGAEGLFNRALAVLEKSDFFRSTRTAQILNSCALTFMGRRKYAEAEPLFEKSLEILHSITPSSSSALHTVVQNNLKMTYQILKKSDKIAGLIAG